MKKAQKTNSLETEIKQSLLTKINELKETNTESLAEKLNYSNDICLEFCKTIVSEGYIEIIDTSTLDGKSAIVKIKEIGKIFLSNGGYIDLENEERIYLEKENTLLDLNIKNIKGNIFHLKYWWVIVLFTVILNYLLKYIPTINF